MPVTVATTCSCYDYSQCDNNFFQIVQLRSATAPPLINQNSKKELKVTDSEDIVDSEPVGGNEDIQLQALLELVSAGVDYYFSEFSLTTCVHIYRVGQNF